MNRSDLQGFFSGKRITVMGLGLLGRGIGDTQFLSEMGADLIVTDLKNEKELAPALAELKGYENIQYVLGEHRREDFENRDMILKAAGVPIESEYIEHARAHNISIEMSAALVAKLSGAKIIGITGTRGKSTVTQLIYHILQCAYENKPDAPRVHLGGNVRGIATLPLLEQIQEGDLVVMELDSWQLQGFGDSKISPNISVFTAFYPDHMVYYHDDMQTYFNDKANIFKYQHRADTLIMSVNARQAIDQYYSGKIFSEQKIVDPRVVTNAYLLGVHNKDNAALAAEVARTLGISEECTDEAITSFKGVEGRLQFVKETRGVKIYNDNNSTTPDATLAALRALGSSEKNIVLIMGGFEKNLDMSQLLEEIPEYCKSVVLFKEVGTDRIRDDVFALKAIEVFEEDGLEATVHRAFDEAKQGDILLYSPAFSSFGKYFKNEYDRNDQFMSIVETL